MQFALSDHLPELIRRTVFNLNFIEEHKSNGGPFEVTQSVNSCLAVIVHLTEQYLKEHEDERGKIDLAAEEASKCWPILRSSRPPEKEPGSWAEQVTCLRHGLAHGNIKFHGPSAGEITAIEIWNVPPSENKRTWGTSILVSGLSEMVRFIDCRFGASPSAGDPKCATVTDTQQPASNAATKSS